MKFRTKLTLLFVAIALFLTIIGTLLIYYSNLKILEAQIKNRLEDDAFHIMGKIDRMLFERFSDIKTIASDPDITSRTTTPQQITERLIEYRNLHKTYISLSFFDLNRVRIADTAGLDIGKQHSLDSYWERMSKNEDFIMEISKSESLQYVLFHFVSLVKNRNGFPFGVVVSRMPVERLYDIVKETSFPLQKGEEEVKIDLVDKNGLLIYSTYNRQGILKDKFEEWELLRSSFPAGKVESLEHFHKEGYFHTIAKEQGHLDFKGNGWTLHIQIPTKIAFAPVVELRNKIIAVASGIILFSIIIVLFFAHTISRPIIELKNAAIEVGGGNLDVNIEVKSKDEVGELGLSFKKMVEKLKSNRDQLLAYTSELETKVAERTIELKNANEQLQLELIERKRTEAALEGSEEKYRTLFDGSRDAVYITSREGEIINLNQAFIDLLGYSVEDLKILKAPDTYVNPADRDRFRQEIEQKGFVKDFEVKLCKKDGTEMDCLLNSFLRLAKDGIILGYQGIIRDITAHKRAEEEREKLIHKLQDALGKIKTLSGLLPICASCKKIRDDKGYWKQIEGYIEEHSEAEFSHGICPECLRKLYPQLVEDEDKTI